MRSNTRAQLVMALGIACLAPVLAMASQPASPKLVIAIVVDQLSRERLDPEWPGGLGQLLREGRVYEEAQLNHGITTTCPGHAVVLTGMNPIHTGITSNTFIDRSNWLDEYCVADDDAYILRADGDSQPGRSPKRMLVNTMGDWLKQASPTSKVFSLSGKDRGAIPLGGKQPDGAYWFNRKTGHFTTSSYYTTTLPTWLQRFNGTHEQPAFFKDYPATWTHPTRGGRPDDYFAESDEFERASPHPLISGPAKEQAKQVYASPYVDDAVARLAKQLVSAEGLGQDDVTDLLALSFSATDTVGHRYGPYGSETIDTLIRLDQLLDDLFTTLDQDVGLENIAIVLTADHGVLPLPEWLADQGKTSCAIERTGVAELALPLMWSVYWHFTGPFTMPWDLVAFADTGVYINRELVEQEGWVHEDILAFLEQSFEAEDFVQEAWTLEEIARTKSDEGQLLARSVRLDGSGADLYLQITQRCLIGDDHGTTHGTLYDYDRDIPLVFFGPGISPAYVPGNAHSVDIAPTLANYLGIPFPNNLDGQVLELRGVGVGDQSERTLVPYSDPGTHDPALSFCRLVKAGNIAALSRSTIFFCSGSL